jgi:20S proteasome alpha/beta subunit
MAITFGLKTNTHLFIVSETVLAESIMKIKDNENSTVSIGNTIASITGKQADSFRSKSYLEQYTKMVSLKYKLKITPELVSRLFSTYLHEGLRSNPMEVQAIVGGRSDDNSLHLFSIDKHGTLHEDNFIVTGYGLYFLFGIYDLYYKEDMIETDALNLIKNCLKVLKERLVLETDKWRMDVIGSEGIRTEFVKLNE